MSGPEHKPDDTLLDDFLAGRSDLSRAYVQAHAPAAPAQLDAAVLAVAASAQRGPVPHWKRLRTPVAMAATVVLGLSVMLNLQRDPAAYQAASAPVAEAPVRLEVASEQSAEPAPVVENVQQAKPLAKIRRPAPSQQPEAPSAALADTAPPPSFDAPMMEATPPPVVAQEAEREESAAAPAMASRKMMRTQAAPAPVAAGAMASVQEESPEDELAHIRALQAAGKSAEALERWQAWRQKYPDAAVPEDLQALEQLRVKPSGSPLSQE